jgi:hypothetical protein
MNELREKITLLADLFGITAEDIETFRQQHAAVKQQFRDVSLSMSTELTRSKEAAEEVKQLLADVDRRLQ